MSPDFDPAAVRFDGASGLVPAVVQDVRDGRVLMLGYMNEVSLARTLETGRVTFWSRSRGRLWEKGETSGHGLVLEAIAADCDGDALLVTARPLGPTCHTGRRSCFAHGDGMEPEEPGAARLGRVLEALDRVIGNRDRERPEGSYTTELLESGPRRAAQKVGEEAVETALAAVSDPGRLAGESADLLYHLLVLWRAAGVGAADVAAELEDRRGPPPAVAVPRPER